MDPHFRFVLALAGTIALVACSDPELTPEGQAGCEPATEAVSRGGPSMLPGRECLSCHTRFTAGGTAFRTTGASCNAGGAAGVRVDVLDRDRKIALTLTTDAVGNFYTRQALPSPYTIRLTSQDGTIREMSTAQTNGDCASCHRLPGVQGATGRISVGADDALDAGTADGHD